MNNGTFFSRDELNRLFRYGCALCADENDAYDLLHHAIEKYLQKPAPSSSQLRNNINERAMDLAYVRTIMRHRYIDQYRKAARFPEQPYDDNSLVSLNETSLEDIVIAQKDLEIIWNELNTMEREILYYWAVEEMTAQEIAVHIDTPRGTILSRLYRIREKFDNKTDPERVSGGHGS